MGKGGCYGGVRITGRKRVRVMGGKRRMLWWDEGYG